MDSVGLVAELIVVEQRVNTSSNDLFGSLKHEDQFASLIARFASHLSALTEKELPTCPWPAYAEAEAEAEALDEARSVATRSSLPALASKSTPLVTA